MFFLTYQKYNKMKKKSLYLLSLVPRKPFKSEDELPASAKRTFSAIKASKLLIENKTLVKSFQRAY